MYHYLRWFRDGIEAVSNPRFGDQITRGARIRLNFFAQLRDEDPQILRLFGAVAAPYGRQDCPMGEDLAVVGDEKQKQVVFLGSEMQFASADVDAPLLRLCPE